jgi:hypothetical protein
MIHKDLSVINLHTQKPSDKYPTGFPRGDPSKLNAWDLDYIDDKKHEPTKPTPLFAMSPEAVRRIFILTCIALLVVFFLLLTCLVSDKRSNDDIHHGLAYGLLNHTVSAFCGLLIFRASKDISWYVVTVLNGFTYNGWPNINLLCIGFFVVWLLMAILRNCHHLILLACGSIGMYFAAFAAADTYFMVVSTAAYAKANDAYICAFLLAIVIVLGLAGLGHAVREAVSPAWPALKQWKVQAALCEDQFAAAAIGYFCAQAAEAIILRTWSGRTLSIDIGLLVFSMVSFVLLSAGVAASRNSGNFDPPRWSLLIQNILLMAAAWCAFDALAWHLSSAGVTKEFGMEPLSTAKSICAAISLTVVVAAAFLAVGYHSLVSFSLPWSDSQIASLRLIVGAMGFIVGNAWALSFCFAITDVGPKYFPSRGIATAAGTASCYLLCTAVVLTLWGACILPRTKITKLSSEDDIFLDSKDSM